jgi:hypothetical protein
MPAGTGRVAAYDPPIGGRWKEPPAPERRRDMSAQALTIRTDGLGAFSAFLLFFVFVLTMLGVIAQGSFA